MARLSGRPAPLDTSERASLLSHRNRENYCAIYGLTSFLFVMYGIHLIWMSINLSKLKSDCDDSTWEYVCSSSFLLLMTLAASVIIGSRIAEKHPCITVMGIAVDFILFVMVSWGAVLWIVGTREDCVESAPLLY